MARPDPLLLLVGYGLPSPLTFSSWPCSGSFVRSFIESGLGYRSLCCCERAGRVEWLLLPSPVVLPRSCRYILLTLDGLAHLSFTFHYDELHDKLSRGDILQRPCQLRLLWECHM